MKKRSKLIKPETLEKQGKALRMALNNIRGEASIHDSRAYKDLSEIPIPKHEEKLKEIRLIDRTCRNCIFYTRKRYLERSVSAFDGHSEAEEPFSCLIRLKSFYDPSEHALDCDYFDVTPLKLKILLLKRLLS